jgi:hypothetical protein
MFTQHVVFTDPDSPSALLWRYMDFPKFVHLLRTSTLFFPSARMLQSTDPFEGSLPQRTFEHYKRLLGYDDAEMRRIQDSYRDTYCVSCWHWNEGESLAMWKLYSQIGNGIAVQTTIESFKHSFGDTKEAVFAGKVIYIDYDSEDFYEDEPNPYPFVNGFVPFIHKRAGYSHEREYRAILDNPNRDASFALGQPVHVRIDSLIHKVVVAPSTPQWIADLVAGELMDILPTVMVGRSSFDKGPMC